MVVELAIPSGVDIVTRRDRENNEFLESTARILRQAGHPFEVPPEYLYKGKAFIFDVSGSYADALTPDGKIVTLANRASLNGDSPVIRTGQPWADWMVAKESRHTFPQIQAAATRALHQLEDTGHST